MFNPNNYLKEIAISLHHSFGVRPNDLSYFRIAAAPWLAIFLVEGLRMHSFVMVSVAFVIFIIAALSDALDGHIAREMNLTSAKGAVLDRLSDKLLVVCALIPFGLNIFTVAIISGELVLAYQAIHASTLHSKMATVIGKYKMGFQTLAIVVLMLDAVVASPTVEVIVTPAVLFLATILTGLSIVSHYSGWVSEEKARLKNETLGHSEPQTGSQDDAQSE